MHCSWDQNLELEEAVQGREQEGRKLSTLLQLLGAEIKWGIHIWAEILPPPHQAEPVPASPPGKSSAVKYLLVERHNGKTQSRVLGSENPLQVSKMDPDSLGAFGFPLPLGVLFCFGLVLLVLYLSISPRAKLGSTLQYQKNDRRCLSEKPPSWNPLPRTIFTLNDPRQSRGTVKFWTISTTLRLKTLLKTFRCIKSQWVR